MTGSAIPNQRENTPWLDAWNSVMKPGDRVLDLGCGVGDDSRDLFGAGCQVIALDLDPTRVAKVSNDIAEMRITADITAGLPFADRSFDHVVASLSLHYFTCAETADAFAEVARVLKPGGWLICRVNAVGDTNFGFGSGPEIEPSVFRQPEGHIKRFFDEAMLRHFLAPCFKLVTIRPRTILQHGIEKRTLECRAQTD
jgi:SAM-dependent methyltransferase